MKKIPTIFKRNWRNMKEVLPEQNPECAWVFAGEGVATRKYDGTCCLIKDGELFKRREFRRGQVITKDFIQIEFDEATEKVVGWLPVDPKNPNDTWHREAFRMGLPDGTYELLGPKIQGNPEHFMKHLLLKHSDAPQCTVPRTFEGLKDWLAGVDFEGLVFHHPDGRMAKIKKRDFGLKRGEVA